MRPLLLLHQQKPPQTNLSFSPTKSRKLITIWFQNVFCLKLEADGVLLFNGFIHFLTTKTKTSLKKNPSKDSKIHVGPPRPFKKKTSSPDTATWKKRWRSPARPWPSVGVFVAFRVGSRCQVKHKIFPKKYLLGMEKILGRFNLDDLWGKSLNLCFSKTSRNDWQHSPLE